MDHLGDHAADFCPKSTGWKNCHDAIVEVLGTGLFRAAGVGADHEVNELLPGMHKRPADIFVHSPSVVAGPSPPLPAAHDVTVSPPFELSLLHIGARRPQAVAKPAPRRMTGAFASKVPAIPSEALRGPSDLERKFGPLVFDSLRISSSPTNDAVGE
eukprot:GFKZ01008768.1.p1 GENE.GFKZ01008768.1~~GFKZ01008768.1.p1  ORF type:complete len:157 (-),score=9.69 GFKZ01008768.1:230-700(-)